MAVEAVRVRPGEFFLATERIEFGLEFIADGVRYRLVGEPRSVGYLTAFVRIRAVTGTSLAVSLWPGLQGGERQH